jgi:hypothetical protein
MFRRVDGLLPVTSDSFIYARRLFWRDRHLRRLRPNILGQVGLTRTAFWRQVWLIAESLLLSHRRGTRLAASHASTASKQALRAWWRSTLLSTSPRKAARSYSWDPGSGVELRYNERWGSPAAHLAYDADGGEHRL